MLSDNFYENVCNSSFLSDMSLIPNIFSLFIYNSIFLNDTCPITILNKRDAH